MTKVRRCPMFCHGPCSTCTGTGYLHADGTPATAEEMLEQLTRTLHVRPKPIKFGRATKF